MSPDESVANVYMCHEATAGLRRTDVRVKVQGHIFKKSYPEFPTPEIMPWMLQRRPNSSSLSLCSSLLKTTRKHLLLPAAKVGAAAPLMSRQLGLDLDFTYNTIPALQKSSRVTQRTGRRDGDVDVMKAAAPQLQHIANVFG